jgi:hypothetical protein
MKMDEFMQRVRLLLFILALILAGATHGQTLIAAGGSLNAEGFPIRGFVLDSTSAEPLPMANVQVKDTDRGASTNTDGYFAINHLPPGLHTLKISYLGYRTRLVDIRVTDRVLDPVRIQLLPEAVALQEIVVTAGKDEQEGEKRQSPRVSIVPMNNATLRAMPSLGAEMDVMRTLQTIPGVKASSDLSSALYVRGGSPDQTLIMMDHNVVYNPSHMFGLFSTFNADAVKHLELMKGGFPAEYGGRSGSVLDVITNEGNRNHHEGLLSVGIISARAALEGPLPKQRGSYAVSGRRTYMEPVLDMLRKSMDTDLPDYYFYDLNGKLNWDLDSKTTLSLAGYAGQDRLKFVFGPSDDRGDLHMDWGNTTLTTRLRRVLSRDLFITGGLSFSDYHSKWGFTDDGVNIEDAIDGLRDYSAKTDLEFSGLPNHRLKAGAWVSRWDFRYKEQVGELNYVDIDTFTYNYSLYLQDAWRIHPLLEVQPGIRAYYHQAGSQFRMDPRLAFLFHVDENKRIKLAGGRYTQWINVISFGDGMSNFDLWVPVDGSMKPAYCDQAVLGFEWDPKEDLQTTVETYYTDMRDIVTFDPMTLEGTVAADPFLFGRGYAWGVELMARKTAGPITGWLGYSLSWTKRRFPGSLYNSGDWFYPKWDRRHDIIAVANFNTGPRWDLSASWRFNTGQGYTQALGIYTLQFPGIDPSNFGNGARTIVTGDLNNYRFPADHRLDIAATYKHHLFKYPARLSFSIYNVYSRRSYWQRTFNTSENPVEINDLKLLPILPLISYEVKF